VTLIGRGCSPLVRQENTDERIGLNGSGTH